VVGRQAGDTQYRDRPQWGGLDPCRIVHGGLDVAVCQFDCVRGDLQFQLTKSRSSGDCFWGGSCATTMPPNIVVH